MTSAQKLKSTFFVKKKLGPLRRRNFFFIDFQCLSTTIPKLHFFQIFRALTQLAKKSVMKIPVIYYNLGCTITSIRLKSTYFANRAISARAIVLFSDFSVSCVSTYCMTYLKKFPIGNVTVTVHIVDPKYELETTFIIITTTELGKTKDKF